MLATNVTMPLAVFILIPLIFIGFVIYFVCQISKMKGMVTFSQVVQDFYPIIIKEMPKDSEFYAEMCDKEMEQISELN